MHAQEKKLKIERGEALDRDSYDEGICEGYYSEIEDLVQGCEWDYLHDIVDETIQYCPIDRDTEILLNIIISFYHRILEFDDDKFLKELVDGTEFDEISTFSSLDALYERYDQVKGTVESDLSNYEIAHHYYRKFKFYFLYAEYLAINQEAIETDLIEPTIWSYDFGASENLNFRELSDESAYRHIQLRATEALKQFYIVKDRSVGEKLPEFYELELEDKTLNIILKEWERYLL